MRKHDDVFQKLHEMLRERLLVGGTNPSMEQRKDTLPLPAKTTIAEAVLREALNGERKAAIVWTGGKDSTLVLHLALATTRDDGVETPPVLFVDHGQHFQETWAFADEVVEAEGLTLLVARNEPLVARIREGARALPLTDLDTENQEEALRAGLEREEVRLDLNTAVGNHLLKTVALNQALRKHRFEAVIAGIRWDESPARSAEVFFSPREDPDHIRVHPILPWTEREVWDFTLEHGLPIHPLYELGYRSFDGIHDSEPTDTRPAWEQDLEGSKERAGRAQDKEEIMAQLRALGYF